MEVTIFWFRRDLRLKDNVGWKEALESANPVLPIFIFDENILNELPKDDARVNFIYDNLKIMDAALKKHGSGLKVFKGTPSLIWKKIIQEYSVKQVITNKDYEPYAQKRDAEVGALLEEHKIPFNTFKDQVIFEENDVLKDDGKPYTIYTPFKNKWLGKFDQNTMLDDYSVGLKNVFTFDSEFPEKEELGIENTDIKVKNFNLSQLSDYPANRDLPAVDGTSYLSPHLRFGTISIREIIRKILPGNDVFLSELIWREFFMTILFHFPESVDHNFKRKYDGVQWRNNEEDFEKWCKGETGYPMVDAGMRQLNKTGYMHNRVRMVTASFLVKHLLIDWKWGEAYFAKKLLDFELSSNVGNWQWAAGTGCDSAPYFRIFNPIEQLKKFDKELKYVSKWIPEYQGFGYPEPMVEHKFARNRCLEVYKAGLA